MNPAAAPASALPSAAPWHTLLTGAAADRAVEALIGLPVLVGPTADAPSDTLAVRALLGAYRAEHLGSDEDGVAAFRLAEHALRVAWSTSENAGRIGVALIFDHFATRFVDLDVDPLDAVDAVLDRGYADLRPTLDPGWYRGLTGVGGYALHRLPRPRAADLLTRVLDDLAATAVRDAEGASWAAVHLTDVVRRVLPQGCRFVGVGRGTAGTVALLAQARAAGFGPSGSDDLLEAAVAWLLARRGDDPDGQFPRWVATVTDHDAPNPYTGRVPDGYLLGETGIAAALLAAARAVGRADWERVAVDIALAAVDRDAPPHPRTDVALAAGAGGLTHLYNRFWQATGLPAFRAAATRHAAAAGDLLPGEYDGTLVTDWAGAGLALLGALGVAPDWDSMLLLGPPVGPPPDD